MWRKAERLQLARAAQRAGVDRVQAAVLREPGDRGLGLLVVGGDEDVERLARHLAAPGERAGERRVEGLDDPRLRGGGRDLLRPVPMIVTFMGSPPPLPPVPGLSGPVDPEPAYGR